MKERFGDNSENPANIINFLKKIVSVENSAKHFIFDEDKSVLISLGRHVKTGYDPIVILGIEKSRIRFDDPSCFKREDVRELAANFLGLSEKGENRYIIDGYFKSPIDDSSMFCTSGTLFPGFDLEEGLGGYLLTDKHMADPKIITEAFYLNLNANTYCYSMDVELEISLNGESEKLKIYMHTDKDLSVHQYLEDMGSKNARKLFRALDIIVNHSKRINPFTGEEMPLEDTETDR